MSVQRGPLHLEWTLVSESLVDDPDMLRLDAARAAAWEAVSGAPDDASARQAAEEAERRYSDMFFAALRQRRTPIDLSEIDRIQERAERLATVSDLGRLFQTYQRLDQELERWERRLEDAAIGWDRYVQAEVDRIRGK